jgi:hypothetical protein
VANPPALLHPTFAEASSHYRPEQQAGIMRPAARILLVCRSRADFGIPALISCLKLVVLLKHSGSLRSQFLP